MSSHYAALLAFCCCQNPPGCGAACVYVAVDGGWVFVPNSPSKECGGECHCTSPDITPDCDGQIAGCVCIPDSESDAGSSPNCGYTVCGSESFPS